IIAGLARAVLARRPGRGHGANVKSGTTSISKASHPGQPLEPRPVERRAQGDAKPQKNGTCAGTCGSISFAMGSETIAHTDFALPGPFPIEWTRTYRSSLGAFDDGALGARWITPYTTRFDVRGEGLRYHGADGRSHDYPLPKVGQFHEDRIEDLTLV
ncbi:DUF6531 domain-containing protein, partial [Burkholderia sp. Bp9004]